MNIANRLTIGRIVLTPPFVLLVLATPEGSLVAALGFAVLALTDILDGHLARSRGIITTLGKLLDPFADKLLVGGVLVALAVTGRLGAEVVVVILAREVLVSLLRQLAYHRGVVIPAGGLGKGKMALQIAMVLTLLALGAPDSTWIEVLIGVTVAMTVASGLSYVAAVPRLTHVRA